MVRYWCSHQINEGGIAIAITKVSPPAKKRTVSVRLFLEKGYKKATLAEIVEKADVSYSTFQNIFRATARELYKIFGAYQPELTERVLAFVAGLDIRGIAERVMRKLFQMLTMHYEFSLDGMEEATTTHLKTEEMA